MEPVTGRLPGANMECFMNQTTLAILGLEWWQLAIAVAGLVALAVLIAMKMKGSRR